VQALLKQGYLVRSTSRTLIEGSHDDGYNNVEHYSFDLGDDSPDYEKLLANVDVLIHLAAKVHAVEKPGDNVSDYYEINAKGTERLASAASAKGIKRFIFLSSIKVNGERNITDKKDQALAFNEDDDPNPQEAYAKSKLEAEDAIRKICRESEMDFVILRPTLVYGPGVRANFLSLIDVVNKNYPLPFASIKNKRSLLYVGNLIHAITLIVSYPEKINKIFLLGDTDISVPELVRKISLLLGKKALLFHLPVNCLKTLGSLTGKRPVINRLTDSLLADASLISKELEWEPPYSFDEGMQETLDWYLQR
jgi:nucleoside-diphosphate-sugar epimerase